MAPAVQLPDDLYRKLQSLAQPFVDRPEDVIRRAVEFFEKAPTNERTNQNLPFADRLGIPLDSRSARERGAKVEIDGRTIAAHSVPNLFKQTLQLLVLNGNTARVKTLVPFQTSNQRYLIADRPIHPNGNRFRIEVEHRGLYMEAHKSYYTALKQLQQFLLKCGISFRYLGA
jgi:metal-responsive CopG/Arc/MetJ family transcriptional regulator